MFELILKQRIEKKTSSIYTLVSDFYHSNNLKTVAFTMKEDFGKEFLKDYQSTFMVKKPDKWVLKEVEKI